MAGNSWYGSKEADEIRAKIPEVIFEAHRHTINHKLAISNSEQYGCFSCLNIFPPSQISEWISDGGGDVFAMCPFCHLDCVLGDTSGFPIKKEFLKEMNKHWFDGDVTPVAK